MLIKEKVKIVEPYRFENIHGHVTIDLHNHKSGFTERVAEGDNLVTDAIKYITRAIVLSPNKLSLADYLPVASNRILGGLMIFDGALTESPSNCEFPGNVHFLASAGNDAVTARYTTGQKNDAESGPVENGYKTVWDFSTNVANGNIASLARTDVRSGNDICRPYLDTILSGKYLTDFEGTYYQSGLFYDYEEGHPLDGYYYDTRANGTRWKQKISLNGVNATAELGYDGAPVASDLVNIKDMPLGNIGGLHYDNRTKIAYSINMGNTLYKYDKSTDTLTSIDRTTEGITWGYNPMWGWSNYPKIVGNYIVDRQEDYIWRAPLNDIRNGAKYEGLILHPQKTYDAYSIYNIGGALIYIRNSYSNANDEHSYFLYEDGSSSDLGLTAATGGRGTYVESANQTYCPIYGTGLVAKRAGSSNCMDIMIASNYLGTIFNLPEPVTKSASQSMKITYTLTNE